MRIASRSLRSDVRVKLLINLQKIILHQKELSVLTTLTDPERRFHIKPVSETQLLAVFFNENFKFVFAECRSAG